MKVILANAKVLALQFKNYFKLLSYISKLFFSKGTRGTYFFPYTGLFDKVMNCHEKKISLYFERQQHYRKLQDQLKARVNEKSTPIKVLFIVSDMSIWSLDNLCKCLSDMQHFEVRILVTPMYRLTDFNEKWVAQYQKTIKFFRSRGYKFFEAFDLTDLTWRSIDDIEIDICIYTSIGTYHPNYEPVEIGKRALTLYVPYGIKTASNRNYSFPFQYYQFNREQHNWCWRVLLETQEHLKMKRKYCDISSRNSAVVGHTKFDPYQQKFTDMGQSQTPIWTNGKFKKRIIWAPHFTIEPCMNTFVFATSAIFSTFHENFRFFLNLVKKHKNIEWCMKPHPLLTTTILATGWMKKDELDQYLDELNEQENFFIFEQGNYISLFKGSDGMITDSVSFLSEYIPTQKPLLFLKNKYHHFNEVGKKLSKLLYTAKALDYKRIENFVSKRVLQDLDVQQEKRVQGFYQLFPEFQSCAGEKIAEFLCESLALPTNQAVD